MARDPSGTTLTSFQEMLPRAIREGKILLNARLRYEHAEQSGLATSRALTISPSFGLVTAPVYGIQALIEGENVTSLLDDDLYNAAGSNNQPGRTVIADPPVTEINQVWGSYSNWNSVLKLGRQRLVLDNARFVGDVDWRQNQQTFDAVTLTARPWESVRLTYGYIWEVRRVFGNVPTLPAGNRNFDSDSHLIHAAGNRYPWLRWTTYAYLLDFANSPANSTATYGGSLSGTWTLDADAGFRVHYGTEFAWQTDYGHSPLSYGTEYYHLNVGADYGRASAGVGMEVLGSDNGMAFRTPLATLAKFNGWADAYLVTPPAGLRDVYAFVQWKLPWELPLRLDLHDFHSAGGSTSYGRELNLTLTRRFGAHWMFLARYAYHDGRSSPYPPLAAVNIQRLWVEMNFTF